jgi:hypothetical protein
MLMADRQKLIELDMADMLKYIEISEVIRLPPSHHPFIDGFSFINPPSSDKGVPP